MKIGIMGFGRIGRDIYRLAVENEGLEVAAVSDVGDPEVLHYLLNCETPGEEQFKIKENYLINRRFSTRIIHGIEPGDVPWEVFDIDIVVDATQKYKSREELQKHLDSGAQRVLLSSLPDDGVDNLIIYGVNEKSASEKDQIISAGSSTANALALALLTVEKTLGIECVNMTSIHAYTSDQPLQDVAGADFRRSRSAAENIIPNENDSVKWVEQILPGLKGKISASALNVPVQKGSLLDLSMVLKRDEITSGEVNAVFTDAAKHSPGLITITDDPIVSSDVIGNRHTIVIDSQATLTVGENMVKVLGWYDNGLSQACRILDLIRLYGSLSDKGVNK